MTWKNEIKKGDTESTPETREKVRKLHITTEDMKNELEDFMKALDGALDKDFFYNPASSMTIQNLLKKFKRLEDAFKDVESGVNRIR